MSTRIVEDIATVVCNAKSAFDRVNLAEIWKGKMKRIDKLRKCIKNMILQNSAQLEKFDLNEILDPSVTNTQECKEIHSLIGINLNDPS